MLCVLCRSITEARIMLLSLLLLFFLLDFFSLLFMRDLFGMVPNERQTSKKKLIVQMRKKQSLIRCEYCISYHKNGVQFRIHIFGFYISSTMHIYKFCAQEKK